MKQIIECDHLSCLLVKYANDTNTHAQKTKKQNKKKQKLTSNE